MELAINLGTVQLKGMAFAAVTGVVLSIIFYVLGKLGIMNEEYKIRFDEDSPTDTKS